jgi:hypothetical protein
MTGHHVAGTHTTDSRTASPTVTLDASAFIQFQRAVQLLCDRAATLTISPSPQTVADRLTDLPHRFDEDAETVAVSRANLAALGDVLRPLLDALADRFEYEDLTVTIRNRRTELTNIPAVDLV